MRLERIKERFFSQIVNKESQEEKVIITPHTIDDFIGLVKKEDLPLISVYSDKIPLGIPTEDLIDDYVFANYFLSSRKSDLMIRYFEKYERYTGKKNETSDDEETEIKFIMTVITAQQRIRKIKSGLPNIFVNHFNLATNKLFSQSELDKIEERRKILRLSPYITLAR